MLIYNEINIELNENNIWYEKYKNDIPVIHFNDEMIFKHKIDETQLNKIIKNNIQTNK